MLVLFRNIPLNTQKLDLELYIAPALKCGLADIFQRQGNVLEINIVRLQDQDLNTLEAHGLVRIEPDKAALRVIRRLNRKSINGRRINVRKYLNRSWHNDLRVKVGNLPSELKNRRKQDRRRKNLIAVRGTSVNIQGMKNFHKTY